MSQGLKEIRQPASMDLARAQSNRQFLVERCEPAVLRHTPVNDTGAASLFAARLVHCTGTSEPTVADLMNQIIALDPHQPANALSAFTISDLRARLARLREIKAGVAN